MSRPKPLCHSGSGIYDDDDQEYDVHDNGNYDNDNIS